MTSIPRVSIVAAVARNRVIGRKNQMPWRLPEDLKRFRRLTLGHSVIMGRKTFDSIIKTSGQPLLGRDNVVVTRSRDWSHAGCRTAHSIEAAIAEVRGSNEAFVIGGAEIYLLALPLAQHLYLTEIEREFDGDALFPEFDRSRWREVSRRSGRPQGPGSFNYAFVEYELVG